MKCSVILAAGAVALVLPLTGCGQNNASKGDEKAGTAAAPAAMRTGPRTGLWRLTSSSSMAGAPSMTQEVCFTREAFEPPSSADASMTCEPPTAFTREGDAMVASVVCTSNSGRRTETDIRVTGDMETSYTQVMTMRITPPPREGMGEITTTVQGERIGDCPA